MPDARGKSDTYPHDGYAWAVVAILVLVGITSYLDRYLISLLVEPIKADLAISDTQISLLQGAAFALFYILFGLPFGALVDRGSRRNILIGGIFLWSMMTFACGLAQNFWQLFLARAGVGIGEACLAPAAFSLIADYFPPRRRGRAMSVYNMVNYLGIGASLIAGGAVLRLLGGTGASVMVPMVGQVSAWQAAFFIMGLPGLLLIGALMLVREESRKGVKGRERPALPDFIRHIGSARAAYMAVYFVSAMTAFVGLTLAAWGPSFFVRSFGMSPAQVGLSIGPVSAVAGVLGCVASGLLSDWLVVRGWRGGRFAIPLLWWPIALGGLMMIALTDSYGVSILALGLITFGSGLGLASVPPTIHDITPNRLRGRATALHFLFSGLLGMGVAPLLIALITDHVFRDASALKASLLVVLVPVALIGFIACLAGQRAYEQARRRFLSSSAPQESFLS